MSLSTLRNYYQNLPAFLRSGEGEAVSFSITTMAAAYVERARLGWLARYPDHAPVDALPLMCRDRKVIRGFDETPVTLRARLIAAPTRHRKRGSPWALLREIRAYLGVDLLCRTVDNSGNWFTIDEDGNETASLAQANWDWDDGPTLWSRFWVILYPPATLWTAGPDWGDAELWDGAWGTPGYTWGSTATPEQVRSIRQIVRDWKPAGTRCRHVIIAFDPDSFDPETAPGAPLPDGGWAFHGDGASTRARSRLDTARYWKGTS